MRPFGYDVVPAYQLRPGMTIITPTGSVIVDAVTASPDWGDNYISVQGRKARRLRPGVAIMSTFIDLLDPLQEMPVRIHR